MTNKAASPLILSKALADKSVQAAVAAIEVYNKPNFEFREEAFSLLMVNAWELLAKAKWLSDHGEQIESLYEYGKDAAAKPVPRLNRCGNPITVGLVYLMRKLLEDKNSGLVKACHDNVLGLVEIRDHAAHLLNKDLNFGRRILEVGTASLQNYLHLITEWFGIDLSRYNFFLMPLSFYHGFEALASHSVSPYPEQMTKLLEYLKSLEQEPDEASAKSGQHVSLRVETRLVRSKDAISLAFRYTDDPNAPAVSVTEEDILKTYPWSYRELCDQLSRRYADFLRNKESHKLRRQIEAKAKLSIVRALDPRNPRSAKQRFYNPNILSEFDKHYTKRTKK